MDTNSHCTKADECSGRLGRADTQQIFMETSLYVVRERLLMCGRVVLCWQPRRRRHVRRAVVVVVVVVEDRMAPHTKPENPNNPRII